MDEKTKRSVREQVGRDRPLAARYIAKDYDCTEDEVLDVACEVLAERHGLPVADLRAATRDAVASRELAKDSWEAHALDAPVGRPVELRPGRWAVRLSRPGPDAGRGQPPAPEDGVRLGQRLSDGEPIWKQDEEGQASRVRERLSRFWAALQELDVALEQLTDDPAALAVVMDETGPFPELRGLAWLARKVLNKFGEVRAPRDARLAPPAWALEAGMRAGRIWTSAKRRITRSKLGGVSSPFYRAFVPWLRLLGVEAPHEMLHEVHRRRREL